MFEWRGGSSGELLGGFRDRSFLYKVLEGTNQGISLVQDLGEQRAPGRHAEDSLSQSKIHLFERGEERWKWEGYL